MYVDGFGFGDETLVGALGVDIDANKMALSVMHATTENKTVCKRLLDSLEDRGFDVSAGVLLVVDGGKAIYHAISDKWGDVALIQRCREHKRRINRPLGAGQEEGLVGRAGASRWRCLSRVSATRWWRAASSAQPRVASSCSRVRMSSRCAAMVSVRSWSATKLSHSSQTFAYGHAPARRARGSRIRGQLWF